MNIAACFLVSLHVITRYHWENRGYKTFDDFLSDLKQSKRKSIRQVRHWAICLQAFSRVIENSKCHAVKTKYHGLLDCSTLVLVRLGDC